MEVHHPRHIHLLIFFGRGIDLLEWMRLYLDIDLEDALRDGNLEIEPLPHDSLLHTPPEEDNTPVAGRYDDKSAPANDNDDEEQNE